ncbi:invasion associated locus B family protein [Methylocella sp.]|jgi:invasion protein IalB|uniref:invasion associated locus B family protein n=1 Tax=Methylocella sp. TaxID=1978226 RepID=UPI003C150B76
MRKTLILAMSALLISPAALLSCAAAMAETQAPATTGSRNPEPVTFGDWTLRCGTSPDGATRACEVDSWITEEGQKQPIAQIAFGRAVTTPEKKPDGDKAKDKPAKDTAAKDKPAAADAKAGDGTTRLVVVVPVNVTIAPGIDVVADAAKPHLTFPFKTCIPAACLAQFELTGDQLQAFRNRSEPGQIHLHRSERQAGNDRGLVQGTGPGARFAGETVRAPQIRSDPRSRSLAFG